jgi:hypothetical protein
MTIRNAFGDLNLEQTQQAMLEVSASVDQMLAVLHSVREINAALRVQIVGGGPSLTTTVNGSLTTVGSLTNLATTSFGNQSSAGIVQSWTNGPAQENCANISYS